MAMHQHLLAAAIAAAAGATCAAALAPVCPSQQADTCFKDVGHAFPPVVGAGFLLCVRTCAHECVWESLGVSGYRAHKQMRVRECVREGGKEHACTWGWL